MSWIAVISISRACTGCTKPLPSLSRAPKATSSSSAFTHNQSTNHGSALRSDHPTEGLLQPSRLSGETASHSLPRCDSNRRLVFLTNNFTLSALNIAELYRCRWQVELFFKWIKQHLRIKTFYGTTENAVRTQIWIAISVYVLVAIVKKELNLEESLYRILQIFSVTLFEKTPILQAFSVRRSNRNSEHLVTN